MARAPYRTRYMRKPRRKGLSVTPLRLAILRVIHTYPHIDTRDIAAQVETPLATVRFNLGLMYKEAMWLKRPYSPLLHDSRYDLLPQAEDILAQKDLLTPKHLRPERSTSAPHDHHAHKVVSGIEISAKKLGFTFHHIDALARNPTLVMPPVLDFSFLVGDKLTTPDYRPFAIETPQGFFFMPGIEYGTGSEDSGTKKKTATKEKLKAWVHIVTSHAYKVKYNFPSLMVPFILPGPRSMQGAMEQLLTIMPNGCSFILFTYVPFVERDTSGLPVLDDMLTRDWKRAGKPDWNFSKFSYTPLPHRSTT